MKLFKLAWDLVGSEFAGRHLQYEKFYAGASFIVRNHAYRETPWNDFHKIVDDLMASYDVPNPGSRRGCVIQLVIAGWTGRDEAALRKHIKELAEIGVKPPRTTPIFYRGVGKPLLPRRRNPGFRAADQRRSRICPYLEPPTAESRGRVGPHRPQG